MAVGAARPAIRRREPAGRRRQYRRRGGGASAARRLHAAAGRRAANAIKPRSTSISISISSATSRRSAGVMRVPNVDGGQSARCRSKPFPEFIAYAKANPGKINYGVGRHRHRAPCGRRAVQDDDRRRHACTCPIAATGRRMVDLMGGQVQVMFATMTASIGHHQRRQAARAGGDHGDAFAGAAGRADRGANSCRATRRARGSASRAPKGTPADIIDKLNQRDQCGPCRSDDQGAARRPGRHGAHRLARRFGKLIADETEKWGKVIRDAGIKAE